MFDCWQLDRNFTVTASLTVNNGNYNAIRDEGSKVFRNCVDASAIFTFYTRNLNPNFSGCRNQIFDFDIPALDLTSFEWTYVLPYARINFPFFFFVIQVQSHSCSVLRRPAQYTLSHPHPQVKVSRSAGWGHGGGGTMQGSKLCYKVDITEVVAPYSMPGGSGR